MTIKLFSLKLYTQYEGTSLAGSDFSLLLMTFANSLDPDQDRQNVGSAVAQW